MSPSPVVTDGDSEKIHAIVAEYIKQLIHEQLKQGKTRSNRANIQDELFAIALRILPEYSDKLDRLVQNVLTIYDRREKPVHGVVKSNPPPVGVLDPLSKTALAMLSVELKRIAGPLEEWIHKFSAIHEESRLTELQRLELRLRLTELEAKYQTAKAVFAKLADPAV